MSLRKIAIILGAALTLAGSSATAKSIKPVVVQSPAVEVSEAAGNIAVSLSFNLKDIKLGRNQEIILTPTIIAADGSDSLKLKSITVCGRNRWYWYVREELTEVADCNIYRAGTNRVVTVAETFPMEAWMNHSTVELVTEETTCCSPAIKVPGTSANGNTLVATINTDRPAWQFDYIFAPQLSDAPVEMALEGSAFVNFVVNRTELNPNYMMNRREINKILSTIDKVRGDKDAVITNIHIKGFASPEGSYANNTRLAQGRTETLARYVNNQYRFAPGIMSTSYDPEDWAGLRRYVADSLNYNIANRAEIIEIIDGPLGYDAKDQAIKTRFPRDYQVILQEIYPWLRHSDYKVAYTIKVYTDIDNLRRLYTTDPRKLRPIDFYTLASQHPEGSREYLEVMKTASQVYPDDPMISLNVANLYMIEGDLDAAQSLLLRAGRSPQADFARGVLAAKRGDLNGAEKFFLQAKAEGIPQADGYLRQIERQRAYQPVQISPGDI